MRKHFINLSNGVEALNEIQQTEEPWAFVRFRSTTLEKKNWWVLLEQELCDDLLMHLALGFECVLHDRGTRRPLSKTCYFGIEVVSYVLNRYWFGIESSSTRQGPNGGKGPTISETLQLIYDKTIGEKSERGGRLRKKLDYYKRFLACNHVIFVPCSESTEHDGDVAFQQRLVVSFLLSQSTHN